MRILTGVALTVAAMTLGGMSGARAQAVEDGVLIIEGPNTSASMVLDPAATDWAYNTRGWTCLDDFDSVDEAIEQAADDLVSDAEGGTFASNFRQLVERKVDEIIDSRSSTDKETPVVPIRVIQPPAPGSSDSDTIRNCFRTATQADINSLKKALADRIALAAFASETE